MRNRFNLALSLATLLATMTTIIVLAAAPPLPSSFYGMVAIANQNVPAGTLVSAWINDTKFAEAPVFLVEGASVYHLDVPGDDPDTPAVEGGRAGDTIRFQVMGFDADQTALWTTATYTQLDLTLSSGPPIALDQSLTTDEDTARAITLTAIDNDPLTFTVVAAPAHGVLSGAPPDLTYTPNTDYSGADSFTFRANDGTFDSNIAAVSITVRPVNDAPRLTPMDDITMNEGESRSLPVSATDPEGDPITLSASGLPPFALFVDNGNGRGTLTLTPDFDDAGIYPGVTIQASDGLLSGTREFTITVTDAAPLPQVRFSPAQGLNAAQWEDGASIVGFSSVQSTSTSVRPENAIDSNTATNWITANGQNTNQWIKVDLAGALHVVDRVVLRGNGSANGLREFEIRVSTTTSADSAFAPIFTGTVPQDSTLHEFTFEPVQAAYIQLFVRNNWGSASNIAVNHFQVWTRDREGGIVSLQEGPPAAVVEFSTQYGAGYAPENALDENPATFWASGNGQTTNQWIKIQLGGGLTYTIDRVRVQPRADSIADQRVRDFEVWVSATTTDDAAFTRVLAATAADSAALQEFAFPDGPVQARYVLYKALNNRGSTCCTSTSAFQVLTPDGANVARLEGVGAFALAASSQANISTGPEKAIDFSATTFWQTANGQVTNQWFKVRLIEGAPYLIDRVRLEAPAGNISPKNFEIRVSNASLADADFVTVFTGTLTNDGLTHWFTFPAIEARYVQLFIRNNHGGSFIQVKGFQVYSPELGGVTVPFDDFSTDPLGAPIVAWSWDFGDGTTSTEQHPVHTFASPGVHPVSLTVTNSNGLSNTATMNYTALQPPTADFTWSPTTPKEGQSTNFTDSSTDADSTILAWHWRFAHTPTEQTTRNSSTSFPDNGEYPVTLTATDSQLLTASVTRTVTALNAPPTANAGSDQTLVWGQNWIPNASVSDPGSADLPSLVCDWDFGDGQTARVLNCNNSSVRVTHAYDRPGVYTAALTVTDKDGASASDVLTATVDKRMSLLSGNLPGSVNNGQTTIAARLQDCFALQTPMENRLIAFTAGSQSVSATTDSSGTAAISAPAPVGVTSSVPAVFAGDDFYYGSEAFAPNLIRNGSFEYSRLSPGNGFISVPAGSDAIDYWRVIVVDVHYMGTYWQQADCYRSVDLDGGARGGLEQSFPTIPGQTYEVQFYMAGNLASGPIIKPMRVSAAGQSEMFYFDVTGKSYTNMGYQRKVWAFTADSTESTLRFESLTSPSGFGPVIDRVQVIPVSTATTDLVVSKNDGQTTASPGEVLTYTITVSNAGTQQATGVLITDTLPASTTFITASDDGSASGGAVTWPTFTLAAGDSVTRTVTVHVNFPLPIGVDTITNTVTVADDSSHGPDLTPDNNTANDVDTVVITPTDTSTPTLTNTPTPTDTPTLTATATDTPTPTATQTPTDTPTPTPTETPSPTASYTPTPSATPTATQTATHTPTATASYTPTATDTPTPTHTSTPMATDTPTPTPTSSSTPTATQTPTPTSTNTPSPTPIPACGLYPIALHANSLAGVAIGDIVEDIYNGAQPGNFGWLTWTGDNGITSLSTSLTPPGDSHIYINPLHSGDHTVSIGDWVQGRPGVTNSILVRNSLDALKVVNIMVPVWDEVEGNGDNLQYHVSDFALVRLIEYKLPGEDRITVRFLGYGGCNENRQPGILQFPYFDYRVALVRLEYEGNRKSP